MTFGQLGVRALARSRLTAPTVRAYSRSERTDNLLQRRDFQADFGRPKGRTPNPDAEFSDRLKEKAKVCIPFSVFTALARGR